MSLGAADLVALSSGCSASDSCATAAKEWWFAVAGAAAAAGGAYGGCPVRVVFANDQFEVIDLDMNLLGRRLVDDFENFLNVFVRE